MTRNSRAGSYSETIFKTLTSLRELIISLTPKNTRLNRNLNRSSPRWKKRSIRKLRPKRKNTFLRRKWNRGDKPKK
jgi:hypothetical protein